jgi:tellurite resistance protein TehA-like permease
MNAKTQSAIYHPLFYLSSLGAGGTTVAFWKLGDVTTQNTLTHAGQAIFLFLATFMFLVNLPLWLKALRSQGSFFGIPLPASSRPSKELRDEHNPVVSTGWMAMPVSLAMLLNAAFVSIPELFGISAKAMAPAGFWIWLVTYVIVFVLGFQILLNTFATPTRLKEFHFGLFLQPLTYGMVAVPGVSMANMMGDSGMAQTALLLGLAAFIVGAFIALLALVFIFLRFSTYGLPDPKVAPTTLLLMPSITVYTIFVLRLLHYIGHHGGVKIPHLIPELIALSAIGLMGAAATLGIIILAGYFKGKVAFGPSWWSFVCPFVALSVLSSITYEFTGGTTLFLISSVAALTVAISAYSYVGIKTLRTIRYRRQQKYLASVTA